MTGRFQWVLVILSMTLQLGCASIGSSGGLYRDSSLSNLNPAPPAMAPLPSAADGDPALDPVYLSSQADYHYTMGEAMSLEGRSEKAVESFRLTLVYDPNSVMVRLRLAAEYVRLGMLTEAIEQAEATVEQHPDSLEARMLLAGLLSSLKMYDQAIEHYHEVVRRDPDNFEAQIYVGAILAEQRKYDEAIKHFNRVATAKGAKEPERAYYYIGRIRAEQGGDHLPDAERAYAQALKLKPDYVDAVLALTALMKEQGKDGASLRLLASFQEKFGPNREVARTLSRAYLEAEEYGKAYSQLEILEAFERDNLNVRIQLALILIEQKNYEPAILRLEDILAQAPELDKIRYYLGAVYEETKQYGLAIQNYAQVPPSSSYFVEANIHSAQVLKNQGKHRAAVEVIEKAMRLRDDVPQFYAYYATLLDDLKEFKTAVSMLNKAVDKFPGHAQLHFFLGSMRDRLGDLDGTISAMKKVLEIDSDHVQALNYLAYTYAEQGVELDAAEDLARRALAMQPNDAYILDTVGWVMFKKGKVESAIRYLEAAYKVKNDEAIIAEHLADAYFRGQMLERARTLYRRASELETDRSKRDKIDSKLAATERQLEGVGRMPASRGSSSSP